MARAAGGNAVTGAWALHGGRLAKIVNHDPEYGRVQILYADDGVMNGSLAPADLATASPPQVAEGEAILADPELPARRTAAWAAGGKAGVSAWALHRGRLGKVASVNFLDHVSRGGNVVIFYADGGVSGSLAPADLAPASLAQVAEGEAILADPELPARRTAAWAAGGEAVAGAWALHRGRLGKVVGVLFDGVGICYADDAVWSYGLEPADVAPASPVQVVQGEAQLDALGARPSSQFERGPLSSQSGK